VYSQGGWCSSTIFDAREQGYNEEEVKHYLQTNVDVLLKEFPHHLHVDSRWYDLPEEERISAKEEALKRIESTCLLLCWSNYVVDGVWFDDDSKSPNFNKPFEEATQVIDLCFAYSQYTKEAAEAGVQMFCGRCYSG